jgi:hypothetical protein
MLNKYDVMKRLITIAEYLGYFMVWTGLFAGCIILWYFVFTLFM